jgi:hypothetical protein
MVSCQSGTFLIFAHYSSFTLTIDNEQTSLRSDNGGRYRQPVLADEPY